MFHRRPSRFRRRQNGRNHSSHRNGGVQQRLRSGSFTNIQPRNNFRSTQSAEKLLEKYSSLAKEALSSGDKTLSENYFQHADHFMRIIQDKDMNQKQNRVQVDDKAMINCKADLNQLVPFKSAGKQPRGIPVGLYFKLKELMGVVASGDYGPTAPSYDLLEDLSTRLEEEFNALDKIYNKQVKEVVDLIEQIGIPTIKI